MSRGEGGALHSAASGNAILEAWGQLGDLHAYSPQDRCHCCAKVTGRHHGTKPPLEAWTKHTLYRAVLCWLQCWPAGGSQDFISRCSCCGPDHDADGGLRAQLARQMALLPVDSRLTAQYLAKATGRDKAPATTEDNPVLSHLLPPRQREVLPRERFSGQRA